VWGAQSWGCAMGRTIHTLFAGLEGALQGLFAVAVACAIIAALPTVLTSIANRGTVDVDSFVPRSAVSPSQAATMDIEGSAADQVAVRSALDDLVWPISNPRPKIVVIPTGSLPTDTAGTYTSNENVIRVSEDVVQDPERLGLSHVLAHEIGHQLDSMYLDEKGRSEFMTLRGRDSELNWASEDASWEQRPQEDFAEVFAALDAPASRVTIQTIGGRIRNATAMSALMVRYEKSASRTSSSPQIARLLPLAKALTYDYTTEPGALLIIFGVSILCAVIGAIGTMGDMVYVEGVRKDRQRSPRHRARPVSI
jgi:hypothetical protein